MAEKRLEAQRRAHEQFDRSSARLKHVTDPVTRRAELQDWIQRNDKLLREHGVRGGIPDHIKRIFQNLEFGHTDSALKGTRGSGHSIEQEVFIARVLAAAEVKRGPVDKRGRGKPLEGVDEWVWEKSGNEAKRLFGKRITEGHPVLANWRRERIKARKRDGGRFPSLGPMRSKKSERGLYLRERRNELLDSVDGYTLLYYASRWPDAWKTDKVAESILEGKSLLPLLLKATTVSWKALPPGIIRRKTLLPLLVKATAAKRLVSHDASARLARSKVSLGVTKRSVLDPTVEAISRLRGSSIGKGLLKCDVVLDRLLRSLKHG